LLKGSGWYVTDFKDSKKSPENKDGNKLKNNNAKPENNKKSTVKNNGK
jgi:predicted nucleic acid-binding Zn ribbon protein